MSHSHHTDPEVERINRELNKSISPIVSPKIHKVIKQPSACKGHGQNTENKEQRIEKDNILGLLSKEIATTKESAMSTANMFVKENPEPIADIYKIGHCIGRGEYGEIRKALHLKTKAVRAVKICKVRYMKPE